MKVSVKMITYNQEKFIAQAIDSILMQKVNFDYEIVIGEDCSTDKTRDIVIDYRQRYPDKIRLLLNEKNLGMHPNSVQAYKACRGELVALLEGDDYWTSLYKLQKQVDFMAAHPECTVCFHDVTVFYENGSRKPRNYCRADQQEISTLEDLLVSDFIPTCSVMFRRGLFSEFPDWYYTLPMGDWPLLILNAQYGKIGYINEVMGVYRVHEGGVWTHGDAWATDDYIARTAPYDINFYEIINEHLEYKYDDLIRKGIARRSYSLMNVYWKQENWQGMRKYLLKAFFAQPFKGQVSLGLFIISLLISFFPGTYRRCRHLKNQLCQALSSHGRASGFRPD